MKKGGKADWLIAALIAGGFILWSRGKQTAKGKIEVITTSGRLYVVEATEAPLLQAKLEAAGETIRSVRAK